MLNGTIHFCSSKFVAKENDKMLGKSCILSLLPNSFNKFDNLSTHVRSSNRELMIFKCFGMNMSSSARYWSVKPHINEQPINTQCALNGKYFWAYQISANRIFRTKGIIANARVNSPLIIISLLIRVQYITSKTIQ